MNTKNGKTTGWELYLKITPQPDTKSVKIEYTYRVKEHGWNATDKKNTILRLHGEITKNIGVAFTNENIITETLVGKVIGKRHFWIPIDSREIKTTEDMGGDKNVGGKVSERVNKLSVKVDGVGSDYNNIGFEATLNFNYIVP